MNDCHYPPTNKANRRALRLHGGLSLSGPAHGRDQHGQATREAIAMRRHVAALMREARETLTDLQT
jgi:hypothetical protein